MSQNLLSTPKNAAPAHKNDGITGFLFALPHLLLFATFVLAPVLYGGYISLFRWHVLAKTHPFVGLGNYGAALSDDIFWIALRNTVY
ncbi:MAG TPA: hypothetical protein VF627_06440, partial [Abditibacterium sp.]